MTEGDWTRKGNRIEVSRRGIIAVLPLPNQGGVFELQENGNLISAAPQLLASLREFMNIWGSGDNSKTSKRAQKRRADMWDAANAAIAKVEGK